MPRTPEAPLAETLADLLHQLGDIAPRRVRATPPPGRATERDLIRLNQRKERLYELVDGILVEKIMGYAESFLAMRLGHFLQGFLDVHDLGIVVGPDGAMRLMPGLVRIPDVSFVSWERLPVRGEVPSDPVAGLAPDLAAEVLSEGNTKREMARKLKEYFLAGVRLVWFIHMAERTVTVYTAPDEATVLTERQTLHGGDVLPGLALPVRQIFVGIAPRGRKKTGR